MAEDLANNNKSEKTRELPQGKGRFRQYLATFVVNLLAVSFGCAVGWCSPVRDLLVGGGDSSPLGEPLSEETFSWLGSATFLGGIPGTVTWGQVADRWGRKWAGYLMVAPLLLGWSCLLLGTSPELLIVGRLLLGFGGTGCFILCPLYVAEVADDGMRGRLGSLVIFFFNAGVVLAYAAGSVLAYRPLCVLFAIFPVIFVIAYWRLPETPAYLWANNRLREARDSLASFRGGDRALVEREFTRMSEASKSEDEARYGDLVRTRGSRRAFLIGLTVMGIQQFDGILVVLTYTMFIFHAAGSSLQPDTSAIIVGLVQLVASYLSSLTVEKSGRKLLLLTSYGIMAVSLSTLGIYFLLMDFGVDLRSYGLVPVVSLCAYIFSYPLGSGPVPYVLMSETFEPRLRALATSTLVVWGTTMAFVTIKIFPFMLNVIRISGCFLLFAGFCVFGLFFVWIYVPETKGRTLLDILEELNGGKLSPAETKDPLTKADV